MIYQALIAVFVYAAAMKVFAEFYSKCQCLPGKQRLLYEQ